MAWFISEPIFIISCCMLLTVIGFWVAALRYKLARQLAISTSISLLVIVILLSMKCVMPSNDYTLINTLIHKILMPIIICIIFLPYLITLAICVPFGAAMGHGSHMGPLNGGVLLMIMFLFYTLVVFVSIRFYLFHKKNRKLQNAPLVKQSEI
jgi:hypothetical protein